MKRKNRVGNLVSDQGRECTRCKVFKEWEAFGKEPGGINGRSPRCRECYNKAVRQRRWEQGKCTPRDTFVDEGRHCSKCKEFKKWEEFNKMKIGPKGYNTSCKACVKVWFEENREQHAKAQRRVFENSKEKYYARAKERYNSDTLFRLNRVVRQRIWEGLRVLNQGKKSRPTFDVLGCSFEELKEHLEKQFQPGMSWNNHGRYGWHIDHIVPLCSANTKEEFYKLCHYTNLQPLWAEDNSRKGGR